MWYLMATSAPDVCGHEVQVVLSLLKDITPSLDPLQVVYQADDALNVSLHYLLQHLDFPGTDVMFLFVDFISAYNTIVPDILHQKLTKLFFFHVCMSVDQQLHDRQGST